MKILILAAGKGTRISRYLSGNPKCTVDIGDKRLIQYTIEMLNKKGIRNIGIVLGYRGNVIKETLKEFNVKYYYNPFYDVTNSIASAWFAKEFLTDFDDTLIMNGDVFLEELLFEMIMNEKESPVMFADGTRKETADYKFFYQNGLLEKYGKELASADTSGEYIGIGRFSKEFMPEFIATMDKMILSQKHSVWWENIIYDMIKKQNVYVSTIDGKFWAEVDYIEDYERILSFRGYKVNFNLNVSKKN